MATYMANKSPKTEVVAFKVEAELAEFLNKLPNKSAFIRKAIAAQLGVSCPLCQGKGVVPRGVHDHFAPLVSQFLALFWTLLAARARLALSLIASVATQR